MSKRHHPWSRRTPHTPEQQDDSFVAGVMDFSRWAGENRQLLVLSAVVLALFVAGGVYYMNFQRSLVTQAVNQLESIHQTIWTKRHWCSTSRRSDWRAMPWRMSCMGSHNPKDSSS